MKPVYVEARDLDDAWFQFLYNCYHNGRKYKITSGSYEGQYRYALDFAFAYIKDPHKRPLAPTVPENSPLPPPTTEEEIEQYFLDYLMSGKLAPNEHYRYGTWIVGGEYEIPPIDGKYKGKIVDSPSYLVEVPNQLQWVIDHFKEKGFGNEHCYITIGYPESNFWYDVPYDNPNDRKTSPCLRGLDFRIIDGKLITYCYFRSHDLVAGFPTNLGGITLLNEYVATALDVEPGALFYASKSLHCYDHAWDYLKARLGKEE